MGGVIGECGSPTADLKPAPPHPLGQRKTDRKHLECDFYSCSLATTRGTVSAAAAAHLQPREEADVHEGVDELQILVNVERCDESCSGRRGKQLDVADWQED